MKPLDPPYVFIDETCHYCGRVGHEGSMSCVFIQTGWRELKHHDERPDEDVPVGDFVYQCPKKCLKKKKGAI